MSGLTQENFRGKKQTGAGCANKQHSEHHEHTYNRKNHDVNGNIRNTNLFDNISSVISGLDIKMDNDTILLAFFIIFLARNGADKKLLLALGYILL